MKKFTRLLALLLAIAMLALAAIGCTSKDDDISDTEEETERDEDDDKKDDDKDREDEETDGEKNIDEETEDIETEDVETEDVETEDIETEDVETEEENTDEEGEDENTSSEDAEITIKEQVLYDQNDVKITAKEYVSDFFMGDGIKLLFENNSAQDLDFGCEALVVNNHMVFDLFYVTVAAGKKANETLYLASDTLADAGIQNIGQIEVSFSASTTDSYDTVFVSDLITIKTSAYAEMDTEIDNLGTELYNEDGICIYGKLVEDDIWGNVISLYFKNTSGENLSFSCEDLTINGYMIDAFFSTDILDGKMSMEDILLYEEDLEENDITSIESLEISFYIYNADTWEDVVTTDFLTVPVA